MPVYKYNLKPKKNQRVGSLRWFAKINYQDHEGNNKQKVKRGFKTKRDAEKFEKDFLEKHKGSLSMRFENFVDLYFQDMKDRLKPTTLKAKQSTVSSQILPFFKDKPVNEITVKDIREWQNEQLSSNLKPTTIRKNQCVLSSIFNYAVKFYELPSNPCRIAGSIGSLKRDKGIVFWTLEEFNEFISYVDDTELKTAYETLYYTGLRIGELQALRPSDFDFSVPKLTVNYTYTVLNGKELFQIPKTPKSRRDVLLPSKVAEDIQELISKSYFTTEDDGRVFRLSHTTYVDRLKAICREHGLNAIRLHDFRHSHASLLIERGYSPALIAERLGHEDIATTLNIYSHLYPNKQNELVKDLNKLIE